MISRKEVNVLDIASVNFGSEFESVKFKLREVELREFKSKYPELFKKIKNMLLVN